MLAGVADSLSCLAIDLPLTTTHGAEIARAGSTDLSSLRNLRVLKLRLSVLSEHQTVVIDMFSSIVRSWIFPRRNVSLHFIPQAIPGSVPGVSLTALHGTREGFLGLLSYMGHESKEVFLSNHKIDMGAEVVVHVEDYSTYLSYWRQNLSQCFPTLDRLSRVRLDFTGTGECSINHRLRLSLVLDVPRSRVHVCA